MTLCPFSFDDWSVIAKYQYPDRSKEEIRDMISQWNKHQFEDRFFEMLAVKVEDCIVGYVSLFEQENGSVSEGVEIYAPYRHQGFAYAAVTKLLSRAKHLGFTTVTAQVRKNNIASLALHEKLGFEITDSFTNKRGHPVCTLSRDI